MRLQSLVSIAPGVVGATLVLDEGEKVEARFTTDDTSGITVANPTPSDLFEQSLSLEETRRVVAAVVAFDRAAAG